ncbi:MAG: hypothetical protein KDB61_04035 [Planctomycetes bacterium]|nr:hypothetical protein [Planctomycetota bacterium]
MNVDRGSIQSLLAPFIATLKEHDDATEQALFEGREALKKVYDKVQSPNLRPQAQAFGAIQAMIGTLIRKGQVDQRTALTAIGEILESLATWTDRTPTVERPTFNMAPIEDGQASEAKGYLKLAGERLAHPSQQEVPKESGPSPFVPTHEGCLGQILVQSGKITNEVLSRALTLQRINGRRLGEVLIAMEAVGIQTLEEALVRQRFLNKCRTVLPDNPPSRLRLNP